MPMTGQNGPEGRRPAYEPEADEPLLSVTEVATLARVSKMTIYRLVDNGELAAFRIGRSVRIPARAALALLRQV